MVQTAQTDDTVKTITFHRVHRIGQKISTNNLPRPIVTKFEHFKQKQLVQRQGRQLKGTDYELNDQFPKEIMQRRKQLHPIRKQMKQQGKKAVLAVDKLYIDGQLYPSPAVADSATLTMSPYSFNSSLRGHNEYYTQ